MRFSLVGRAFTPNLHRKILVISGIFDFHNLLLFIPEEGVREVRSQPTRYANFTEKQPFESGTQISLSGECLKGTGIERIACADGGSNKA